MRNLFAGVVVAVGTLAAACAQSSPPAPEVQQRPIIGGSPAGAWQFPATGGLVLDGHIFCTGTLVAPSAVLTAAHCVDPEELDGQVPDFTLEHNEANLSEWGENIYLGMNVRMHPGYRRDAMTTSPGLVNDIGVLLLREEVTEVEPERLLEEGAANALLEVGTEVTIVGYGFTDLDLTRSGIKYQAVTPLVEVGDFELLMSEPGDPQPCYGDSGGPVYVHMPDGSRRIAGVVSRGPGEEGGCDDGAIATRTDPYLVFVASASETASCATAGGGHPPWAVLLGLLAVLGLTVRRRRR